MHQVSHISFRLSHPFPLHLNGRRKPVYRLNRAKSELIHLIFHPYLDSLHGRRIVRALWDYYKISGVVSDSLHAQKSAKSGAEHEGPGEAGFSMLKLREIARQRELFSSFESLTSSDEFYDDDEFWSDNEESKFGGPPAGGCCQHYLMELDMKCMYWNSLERIELGTLSSY